jgi:methionine-R-sulfoxide reductase/methionine-S-sulfoxide reductase
MKALLTIFGVTGIILAVTYFNNIYTKPTTPVVKTQVINEENLTEAYFAGGCFWCMEGVFESQEWVKEAVAGYIGGMEEKAKYDLVSGWKTKHREAVKIIYDPSIISYDKLVELYWTQIDPTDAGGQFADRGFHYTTAIFYGNDSEKTIAQDSIDMLNDSWKFEKQIATKLLTTSDFYDAEEYHQDYYKKSATRYKLYEKGSGRKDYKEKTWSDFSFGDEETGYIEYSAEILKNAKQEFIVLFFHANWCPTCKAFEETVLTEVIPENIVIMKVNFDTEAELRKKYNILSQTSFVIVDNKWNLRKRWIGARSITDIIEKTQDLSETVKVFTDAQLREKLTPLQYKVTQEWWTEPPFNNLYWDNKAEGIYVDVIDGTPLFSSTDKYESGTGWPAFTKPIDDNFLTEEVDDSLFMERTEIKAWDNHLGHVFTDGPESEGWLRYCINSAALNFVPKAELKAKWYEKYLELF